MERETFFSVIFIAFLVAAFITIGILLIAEVSNGRPEDEREVRRYGDMACVYNITEDEIEECN